MSIPPLRVAPCFSAPNYLELVWRLHNASNVLELPGAHVTPFRRTAPFFFGKILGISVADFLQRLKD